MRSPAAHLRPAVQRHLRLQQAGAQRPVKERAPQQAPAPQQQSAAPVWGEWEEPPAAVQLRLEEVLPPARQQSIRPQEPESEAEEVRPADWNSAVEARPLPDSAGEVRRAALLRPYTRREVHGWNR